MRPPSDSTRKLLNEAVDRYQDQLMGSVGQTYLHDRGLSNETIENFRLGFVADPLDEHRHLKGRITIPYLTQSGAVSMRFREVPPMDSGAKYKGWAGISAKLLFNVSDLWTIDTVYITEGEIDCMTAHQAGLRSVGVAGVSNWDKNWWRVFRNRSVVILADNDDKGQGAGMAEEIMESIRDSRVVMMPSGHDVSSFVQENGPQALLDRIKEKLHV